MIPPRFLPAIQKIQALEKEDRYRAAFIFGSVAEGTSDANSDLDARVVVNEDNPCTNINHPTFPGFKIDLTFRSLPQEIAHNRQMIEQGTRQPNLARAIILFDKTGELTKLQELAKQATPKLGGHTSTQHLQFMLYHANNKVERTVGGDPHELLFVLHLNFQEVLKVHYQIHTRWWLSSKKLFQDLKSWDPPLARLTERFVSSSDSDEKYKLWQEILTHIAKPLGGLQPISENNCSCEICRKDLRRLML